MHRDHEGRRLDATLFVDRTELLAYMVAAYVRGESCNLKVALGQDCPLIAGHLPAWLKTERWEIQAKLPANTVSYTYDQFQRGSAPEVSLMLQVLLEERFHLKVHRETREIPVYALTVAKNGPKLKPSVPGSELLTIGDGSRIEHHGLASQLKVAAADGSSRTKMTFRASSMQNTADAFAPYFDRPVLDRTGLKGDYDFEIQYEKDPTAPTPAATPTSSGLGGNYFNPFTGLTSAALSVALRDVGLRLESTKAPLEILVIDQVERPSEN